MPSFIDITGLRFGRLVVKQRKPELRGGKISWLCKCDCGGETVAAATHLKRKAIQSCGCLLGEVRQRIKENGLTHGLTGSKEYRIWGSMIQRCRNKKNKDFKYYGGRGITVCKEWEESFSVFYKDMGPKNDDHQIDRINNDLGYSKENCRWTTQKRNARNSRLSKRWIIRGVEYNSLSDAARALSVDKKTISRWCNSKKEGCSCEPVYPSNL